MPDPTYVHLADGGAAYGPFDDPATAAEFSQYVTDEIDPARIGRLRDPVAELLAWRRTALAYIADLKTRLADQGREIEPGAAAGDWVTIVAEHDKIRTLLREAGADVGGPDGLPGGLAELLAAFGRTRERADLGASVVATCREAVTAAGVEWHGDLVDGIRALSGMHVEACARANEYRVERDELARLRKFDILRIDLNPGDVLVAMTDAMTDADLTDSEGVAIEAALRAKFPHHRIAVVSSGISLAAVRTIPPTEPNVGRVVWGVRPTADMRRTMGWPEVMWCDSYDDALNLVRDDAEGVGGWFTAAGNVSIHPWPAGTGEAKPWPPFSNLVTVVAKAFENLPADTTLTADQVEEVLRSGVFGHGCGTSYGPTSTAGHRAMLDAVARSSGVDADTVDKILTWCADDAAAALGLVDLLGLVEPAVPDGG